MRHSAAIEAPKPPNLQRIVALNQGPWVGRVPELQSLGSADGVTVLDVRPVAAFAAGHVAGSLNVPLAGSGFGTKAGFVLSPDEPIAIHAATVGDALDAAERLHAVGFLDLAGILSHPPLPASMTIFTEIAEVESVAQSTDALLVDVRDEHEFACGSLPGSVNIPYRLLRARVGELPAGRVIVPFCESGARAGIAGSILAAAGLDARPLVEGGVSRWLSERARASA